MTIAERKAREAYDRENPWRPIRRAGAEPEGSICELRRSDAVGLTDFGAARFFLGDDGCWYRIDPAERMWTDRIVEYRPTGAIISKGRRELIMLRAENSFARTGEDGKVEHYEYRGGRLYPKPKSYKLYWRADD